MSVACGIVWMGATTGCDRSRPATMTATMATMNATVWIMKRRAASATPHRLAPVIRARAARQSQTRAPYRAGNAEVRASIPAETPTAALST